MNKKLIIEKTKEFVKEKLYGEGSGHDWFHIENEKDFTFSSSDGFCSHYVGSASCRPSATE